jgi:HAD superfamily hydrolase (TIGR01459 family)
MPLPIYSGLAEVIDLYSAYILDVWGVLHNGREPYPGVRDCLQRLQAAEKKVVLLSNAPRRADRVRAMLARLGIPDSEYDHVVTSGDLTREALAVGALGPKVKRYFSLGPESDGNLLDGLDFERVTDISAADFILAIGFFDPRRDTLQSYAPLFAAARARDLLMLCANPDLEVMWGGQHIPCAGTLAAAYAAAGGAVQLFGKPTREAYNDVIRRFDVPPERVLAIGDSLRTDIAGANGAGLDSLLVTGGIHAREWAMAPGDPPYLEKVAAACAAQGCWPKGLLAEFRW